MKKNYIICRSCGCVDNIDTIKKKILADQIDIHKIDKCRVCLYVSFQTKSLQNKHQTTFFNKKRKKIIPEKTCKYNFLKYFGFYKKS